MLTIKRVATVVSNYQEDGSSCEELDTKARGCGRNCLGKCCLPVSKLPVYTFKNDEKDSSNEKPQVSLLNNLLLGQWEERMNRGLFRYDVTSCETKIIPSKYGFIAQLNEGRQLKKRLTEFRIDQVLQPFDENKFNFTKVGQEEVLFKFESICDNKAQYSPNVVAINVSPIEYGHVLLIPRVLDCLPQRIDHESLLLAIHFAKEAADPYFRVGYNSLGAFATINHLHFQAYYLAVQFPVEKTRARKILTKNGVHMSELLDYPVRGLVFEGGNKLRDLSNMVANSCIYLQNNNIPFNVLIAECGKKIFLFPQCYAEKQALGEVKKELLETQVNPAVWEISGHMVLKRRKDYDDASEEYAWKLLSEVSLSEERFEEVKVMVFEANIGKEEEVIEAHVSCGVPHECFVATLIEDI